MIAAIVLAAGTSSRYGENKLLLPFENSSVLRTSIARIADAQPDEIFVVTGHDEQRIKDELHGMAVHIVHNPHYLEADMISSIQAGLRALEQTQADAALIALGDMPLLPSTIVAQLMRMYRLGCGDIIAPRFGEQRGHPVLIARRFWPEALTIPARTPLRVLLAAHMNAVALLQVNTDRILRDVDTPALYAEALAQART
ncbi:MAG: nucleotidyltransferase family protein [Chloroflexi bacterium]|nr:nucleotidyltransferase family protein [Chloroflexota bacterium]